MAMDSKVMATVVAMDEVTVTGNNNSFVHE
jgi:hypothetical protein